MVTTERAVTPATSFTYDDVDQAVATYERDGFVKFSGVIAPDLIEKYRAAAEALASSPKAEQKPAFVQYVNAWCDDDAIRELTLSPILATIATALAGVRLRLWHDHLLIKQPGLNGPTAFHQDGPFWPHQGSGRCLSAWIPLVDVPVERGCLSFIPGTQYRRDLPTQNTRDSRLLFDPAPEFEWMPRVTVPLKAGDCTFHNGYLAHAAHANTSTVPRIALSVIYMDESTRYTGRKHPVTDPLGLAAGSTFPDDLFPKVPR